MNMQQPSTQRTKYIALQATLLCCFSIFLLLVSLLAASVQPLIFLVVTALGLIVGMTFSRHRYPTWAYVLQTDLLQHKTPWYVGVGYLLGFLLVLLTPIFMNHLAEPWNIIFTSIVLGALFGFLTGYYLWFVGLYMNRDKVNLP
jgi:tetrahydromethanopterin S-methyltransferase subunit E